jgi:hypothetical protein
MPWIKKNTCFCKTGTALNRSSYPLKQGLLRVRHMAAGVFEVGFVSFELGMKKSFS